MWPVFLTYVLAFVGIVACTVVAAGVLRSLQPDLPDGEVFQGLPALLAGGLASSTALLATMLAAVRPLTPARLRLTPGRERGRDLLAIIVGTLALGQALDSIVSLTGLGRQGSMESIRQALEGAAGPDLFGAVVVIGLLAGSAEELFFRGYMQTALGERWPRRHAIVVTSACFGLLHLEWRHALLALALGLWLGTVTEVCGSVLPAMAAHVVNNGLFTVLTAGVGPTEGRGLNLGLLAVSVLAFAGCALWLRRSLPGFAPRPVGPPGA